jgi:ferritin-like metal-binding protein YciE
MGLFSSMTLNSLNDLVALQLQDLYDAEQRLTKALPKMADAASSKELKSAFQKHLRETEEHVTRLEKVFNILGLTARRETCEAMKGLIAEGDAAVSAVGDPEVRDAALIAAAQRVEHYEIAGYGTVRTLAERLGHDEIARILQQTLDEEGACDKKLTEIAESRVNVKAAAKSGAMA